MARRGSIVPPWWAWLALAVPVSAAAPAAGPVAQAAATALVLVGLIAGYRRWSERRLWAASADLTAIRALDWRQFEAFIAEAFRREGHHVVRRGGASADGGVDLELHRDGKLTLVQCKHWRAWDVNVKVVRELYGVVAAEGAAAGIVVTAGHFTPAARRFAEGLPLSLIDGVQLAALRRGHPA